MTTPAAPEWHERVTNCRGCPFHFDDNDQHRRDADYCIARTRDLLPAFRLTPSEVHASTPPEWCPLRAGPRVVRLAEEGQVRCYRCKGPHAIHYVGAGMWLDFRCFLELVTGRKLPKDPPHAR